MWQRTGGRAWRSPASGYRVLIENPSPALQLADFSVFSDAGLDVALCSGPDGDAECPLVEGRSCPLADGADVIMFGLDAVTGPEILERLQATHPTLPIVVEVRRSETVDVPDGCVPMPFPATVDEQVRVVRRAATASSARLARS
jgi:hypothetical protein